VADRRARLGYGAGGRSGAGRRGAPEPGRPAGPGGGAAGGPHPADPRPPRPLGRGGSAQRADRGTRGGHGSHLPPRRRWPRTGPGRGPSGPGGRADRSRVRGAGGGLARSYGRLGVPAAARRQRPAHRGHRAGPGDHGDCRGRQPGRLPGHPRPAACSGRRRTAAHAAAGPRAVAGRPGPGARLLHRPSPGAAGRGAGRAGRWGPDRDADRGPGLHRRGSGALAVRPVVGPCPAQLPGWPGRAAARSQRSRRGG
jgi:translation initiation factor IF-2